MLNYIEQAGVLEAPIDYIWKQAYVAGDFCPKDPKLENKISSISSKGVMILSTGFAEWVAWAAHHHFSDPILLNYIEAVRAGTIDWKYLKSLNSSGRLSEILKWNEKPQASILIAMLLLGGMVKEAKKGISNSNRSATLSELALFVTPNKKAYKKWRRLIVERFVEAYPYIEGEENRLVPIDALDPNISVTQENSDQLMANFISNLDYEANPFLMSPTEMKGDGFIGAPYEL